MIMVKLSSEASVQPACEHIFGEEVAPTILTVIIILMYYHSTYMRHFWV